MKILVIPSWYPPNGGEFFRQQSQVLSRQGHEVKVVAVNSISMRKPIRWLRSLLGLIGNRVTYELDGIVEVARLDYPAIPRLAIFGSKIYAYAVEMVYQSLLKRYFNPDVLHVHSLIWAGVAAQRLKEKYGISYFITEHRSRFVKNQFVDSHQLRTISDISVAAAAQKASKIYAVSEAMLPALKALVKGSAVELGVISNMVNVDFFSPEKKDSCSNRKFRFFSLAGLDPLKGFVGLVEAFGLLILEVPRIELVIGGEGRDRERIEAKVAVLGLKANVTLLGRLDRNQVRDEMRKSDAFVLATRYEAFGVVFIEAMACGLPIVTTKSGGPEAIVTDEVGYLSQVGDVRALAENMRRVLIEHSRFDPLVLHNLAKQKYSEDVIGAELIHHLREVSNAG